MRIRTVKPEFFIHEGIFDAEDEFKLPLRIAFIGLWCVSDREGRFKWRPRTLKTQIMPFDDVDFSRVLDALSSRGFVVKYVSNGEEFGFIPSFTRHQVINNRERESELPEPDESTVEAVLTRERRVNDEKTTPLVHALVEGKGREQGKEGKGREQGIGENEVSTSSESPDQFSLAIDPPQKQSCPFKEIVKLYHETCISLPRILKDLPSRRTATASLWKTYKGDLAAFKEVFEAAERSDFLTGRKPSQSHPRFRADFDWIMKTTNFTKVYEGKYDNE